MFVRTMRFRGPGHAEQALVSLVGRLVYVKGKRGKETRIES